LKGFELITLNIRPKQSATKTKRQRPITIRAIADESKGPVDESATAASVDVDSVSDVEDTNEEDSVVELPTIVAVVESTICEK